MVGGSSADQPLANGHETQTSGGKVFGKSQNTALESAQSAAHDSQQFGDVSSAWPVLNGDR